METILLALAMMTTIIGAISLLAFSLGQGWEFALLGGINCLLGSYNYIGYKEQ